ncbi:MAG: S1 domain-containing RNA-binding protein [Caldicoprobacterales bacterium]|jgi:S1 RNA binding domain protein|nr:RNA-binding protein S1 [Clostridiales bacterium]
MSVEVGQILEGTVSGITNFGAFVELGEGKTGMVHISEIADAYVKDINAYLKINDKVKVKVLSIDEKGKISLSVRQAAVVKKSTRPADVDWSKEFQDSKGGSFEEVLSKFMKDSEERLLDIKRNRESKRGGGRYSRGRG